MTFESLAELDAQKPRAPGLYIGWKSQALAGRHALGGGVPVFIGFVKPGAFAADAPRARWFDGWERFTHVFTPNVGASLFLMHAVRGFFENGGERCLVVPVTEARGMEGAHALAAPLDEGGFLENIEEIDLVCVPDAMSPLLGEKHEAHEERDSLDARKAAAVAVQASAMEHCTRMGNRFAVLDAMSPETAGVDIDISADVETRKHTLLAAVIAQWQTLPAQHGALYFPWIAVKPLVALAANQPMQPTLRVPPCGHIAGIYARCDRRVGVFKPPANEVIEGALDLDLNLADTDQAVLNQAGINCLRERPGWGLRVWGARTLSERPELRYVNVTRLLLAITRELEYHLRDLTFEPNNPLLWEAVAERLEGYFSDLYRAGALKGADPREAYFVKCDAETNPPAEREAGRLVAMAGLAAAAPAEFVVVRITQSADGVSVAGPDMRV
ncbi:Phage tail sheath protein FI (plasmid) [Paraburkholderia caribensis MBA4]|uniref:Phage tail sheath protein FI n=1 Tax=Paraburkholderia caribensis MBA4 TaxID=1323664 RepID=A0A0N7JW40_9BURK|nr:phage tail sheath subtilisin-like domain-containing protein [Paraburkholderia caribensis]ALL70949.1 Phage tail sheath protein FI [Paraburkholderia caribensis MBA4]